jgi:UDP-GlcNAc:undecaprenyl-phosphate GlcNAc-1-phosphate transferase
VGGRDHSSHRLVAIGLSERAAVAVLWLLAAIGGLLGVAVQHINGSWSIPAATGFLLAIVLIAIYLARIRVYEGADAKVLREGTVTPILVDFMYKRRVAEVLLDFFLISLAYYAAYRLRFEGEDFMKNFNSLRLTLPVVVAAQMVAFFAVGVYRGVWRYFGLNDAVVVVAGALAGSTGALILIMASPRFISYSRTVFAIDFVLAVGLVVVSRASFRLIGEFVQRGRQNGERVVIYGAGDAGALVVRELLSRREAIRILGFIDDDLRKTGNRVGGYRVLGDVAVLETLVTSGAIDTIVVSTRSIDEDRLRPLADLCGRHRVATRRLRIGFDNILQLPPRSDSGAA